MESLDHLLGRLPNSHGFQLSGIAAAADLPDELARLHSWLAKGYHGGMAYLAHHPERRADVRLSEPRARSVLMLGMNYYQGEREEELPSLAHGRVSRYARGKDYHDLIGQRLERLAQDLAKAGEELGWEPLHWRAFVDASPLLERQYAERAGLGFVGKHTLLIHPGTGSYYFLAGLALSWDLPPSDPLEGTCGRCTRCLDTCPTDAFPQAGVLDARRCISYLTIEHKGPIDDSELARGLGDWVFGCDACQDVCPYNKNAPPTREADFRGPAFVDLRALAALRTNRESNEALAGLPMQRARRRGLQRTAALLMVNRAEEMLASGVREACEWTELDELAVLLRQRAAEDAENPGLAESLRNALGRYDLMRAGATKRGPTQGADHMPPAGTA